MSKVSSLVIGVVAGAAMFSAIQYASGNDLRGTLTDQDRSVSGTVAAGSVSLDTVNRSAKGDRGTMKALTDRGGQTVAFRLHGMSDTSVLLRLAAAPVAARKPEGSKEQSALSAKPQRASVACEPPVSVLTDVAKLLQPGRCVT